MALAETYSFFSADPTNRMLISSVFLAGGDWASVNRFHISYREVLAWDESMDIGVGR